MGGWCACKKVLKILAGLALIAVSLKYVSLDPWLVLGVFLLLVGLAPFVCKSRDACCCGMPGKKKR